MIAARPLLGFNNEECVPKFLIIVGGRCLVCGLLLPTYLCTCDVYRAQVSASSLLTIVRSREGGDQSKYEHSRSTPKQDLAERKSEISILQSFYLFS